MRLDIPDSGTTDKDEVDEVLDFISNNKINELYSHPLATFMKADAVTIGSSIYYRKFPEEIPLSLKIHEVVHVMQCREFSTPIFLLKYGLEYLSGRLNGMTHRKAYLNISFEKEAFSIENKFLQNTERYI